MAQVVNEYRGLGETLGTGLGQGFGATLQQLANMKLNQVTQNAGMKDLIQLGLEPAEARIVNQFGPKEKAQFLAAWHQSGNQQQPTPAAQAGTQQLQPPQQAQQQNPSLESLLSGKPSPAAALLPYLTSPSALRNALSGIQQPQIPQEQMQPEPMSEQQPGGQQQQPNGNRNRFYEALSKVSPKGADTELKERKQTFAEQESLKPFLNKKYEQYQNDRAIEKVAKEALSLLRKHYRRWPGAFKGSLTGDAQRVLERDPYVREYAAKLGEIVLRTGQSRKGLPSNYKLRLEQLAKADLSQPLQTQEQLLEAIVDRASESRGEQKFINSLKDQSGNFPRDTQSKITDYEMATDYPLENPQFFSDNTVIEVDGVRYRKKNGEWKEV